MSAIETYLQYIANKVWARDVRTAIVNAIRQCYDDVHNPTLNTEALQAAIQAKIDAGQMAALTIGDRTITAAKLALGVIPTPDTTLSQSGVPADAKKAGDEIASVKADLDAIGSGLSEDVKIALLNCFAHVYWDDGNGQQHYDDLMEALDLGIVSISATFTQGNNVFSSTDSLEDLKPFLVVRGSYANGDTEEVQSYTLSGNLDSATSTITVTYGSLTTTFTVSVSTLPAGYTLKSYVTANGTQAVASGIYETDMSGKWTRYKASVSELLDRAGHILSSTNEFTPYPRYFPTGERKAISYQRFGGQTATTIISPPYWQLNTPFVTESYKESGKVYVDGNHVITITPGTTMSSSNQLMFFQAGANTSPTYRFRGNLYYFKVFNAAGTKIHDYVPCKNSSNVAGLYDLVDGVFHAPSTGTLSTD